jgi:dUTP pyrophosphatase
MSALNRDQIGRLIESDGLVEGYIDLGKQLQPNGFDLTVKDISSFRSVGRIDFDGKWRFDAAIHVKSPRGNSDEPKEYRLAGDGSTYQVEFNETVNLSLCLMATSTQRSSVMRNGAFTAMGCWDVGYRGRGKTLLTVMNPFGLIVTENARLVQMIFHPIKPVAKGYEGKYQGEGAKP